jgi:hypothetical protein
MLKNAAPPEIEVYCGAPESRTLAESVGYGIEEEGLPYRIINKNLSRAEAYDLTKKAGFGVAVLVANGRIAVFTRQTRSPDPLFDHAAEDEERAKTIGKNAARIVKNKPFIEPDE